MTTTTPAVRVTPLEGLRQTGTLAWRTLVQVRHNPYELLDFSLQPIMFVLLFTYVFGGAIAGSTGAYLTFALPGIIVMNMLFVTMYVGLGLNTDLTKGVFDRLRSLPIARWAPLTGRITADLGKQAWSIFLLLVVGFILGFRLGTNMAGAAGRDAAAAVVRARVLVGVGAGRRARQGSREGAGLRVHGPVPVTFVSNVFVPAASMPGWLQPIVRANPVSILSDATRGLLVGGPVATPVMQSLLWTVGIAAVFAPLSMIFFKRRI
jgi:oleandomycin transport system permease protein